jgi:hypothetical protein
MKYRIGMKVRLLVPWTKYGVPITHLRRERLGTVAGISSTCGMDIPHKFSTASQESKFHTVTPHRKCFPRRQGKQEQELLSLTKSLLLL